MSDDDGNAEEELEERPIAALHDFAFEADPEFRGVVRRSIDRRITGGEIVRLTTQATLEVFLEFLSLGRPANTPPPEGATEEE